MPTFIDELILPPSPDEVLAWFTQSSGLWWNHWTFTVRFYLHYRYSFPLLVLFPMLPFGYFIIQGGIYMLVPPLLVTCRICLMSYLSYSWASGSLQLELGYVNPWFPWWTTYLNRGGCCISSGSWTLPALTKNPCLHPTLSSWYPCSTCRVVMMRRSRGWIFAQNFLSRFPLKWKSH